MTELSLDEKMRAVKISQALQTFFDQNPGTQVLRSTEAYEILVTKKLVERDRHHGIFFRKFLSRLKDTGVLGFLPQCKPQPGSGGNTAWYFYPAPGKTAPSAKLRPVDRPAASAIDETAIRSIKLALEQLPKRNITDFDPLQIEKRRTYPRAYEYWTAREQELLKTANALLPDLFRLAELFGRQPSVLEEKLKSEA